MSSTLNELIEGLGCSYDFVNNLIRRDLLTTKLQRGKRGKARTFSRENALEIGFLSILSGVGFGPTESSQQAQLWLKAEAAGTLHEWSIRNPNAEDGYLQEAYPMPSMYGDFQSLTLEELANLFTDKNEGNWVSVQSSKPASALIIVRPGEMVRRVDAIFKRDQPIRNRG